MHPRGGEQPITVPLKACDTGFAPLHPANMDMPANIRQIDKFFTRFIAWCSSTQELSKQPCPTYSIETRTQSVEAREAHEFRCLIDKTVPVPVAIPTDKTRFLAQYRAGIYAQHVSNQKRTPLFFQSSPPLKQPSVQPRTDNTLLSIRNSTRNFAMQIERYCCFAEIRRGD